MTTRNMATWMRRAALSALTVAAATTAAAAAERTIRVGMVRTLSAGAMLIAVERGYFKELGLDIVIDELDSSANALALLSQNRFQVVIGGLSAGYFNAL